MLGWKRRLALGVWVGLFALTFSPASSAVTVNGGDLVCSDDNWCWRKSATPRKPSQRRLGERGERRLGGGQRWHHPGAPSVMWQDSDAVREGR